MAKLTLILTLFLISLFYVTLAVAGHVLTDLEVDLPSKPTILLPSQKQEPEKTTNTIGFAEIIPDKTQVEVTEIQDFDKNDFEVTNIQDQDKTDVEVTENQDLPMKIARFHPINRHFPTSKLGSFRLPLHRCRHDKDVNLMNRYRERNIHLKRPREFSFGDDMMVRAGENGDFDPMVHVEVRQVPEQWIFHRHHRHHHHHHDGMPRFPMGKHHDFFANHRFGEERDGEREDVHGREEKQDSSFMRSVRKFLNGRF